MKVGIVHFMAYPGIYGDPARLLKSLEAVAHDSFFGAIEVTSIPDGQARQAAARLLKESHMAVGFGAQPRLLNGKLDLNSADPKARQQAVAAVNACIDEAYELGASRLAVLSGPDPGPQSRQQALKLLIDSLDQLCSYAESRGNLGITLEVFDRDVDKRCLIGTTALAVNVAEALRPRHPGFGIIIDLSHLPLLGESPAAAAAAASKYLVHAHMGNCVVKDAKHPAYGDAHPRFGIEGGENDVPQLREFLKALLDIGYIGTERQNVVAFEVKPLPGESSESVIAGAKRTLMDAWAGL